MLELINILPVLKVFIEPSYRSLAKIRLRASPGPPPVP